jgi:hypothetical protein
VSRHITPLTPEYRYLRDLREILLLTQVSEYNVFASPLVWREVKCVVLGPIPSFFESVLLILRGSKTEKIIE